MRTEKYLAQAILDLHTVVVASLNDTDNRRVRDQKCVAELTRLADNLSLLKEIAQ